MAAGLTMEQPVSVPSAAGIIRAARAAPDPPELPPGLRCVSQGLTVGGLLGPQANSVLDSLPRSTIPASCRRDQTVASKSGTKSSSTFELAVVGMPFV